MTREYPPEVYGGAGVHVTELVAQLRKLCDVDVHCMGAPRPGAFVAPARPARCAAPTRRCRRCRRTWRWPTPPPAATVVHSHTWYTGLAGHLAALLYGIPHVLTAHSLEPMRPWKAEQLGGGYRVSSWVEQHRHRGRRRGDRGELGHARGRAEHLPGAGSRPGPRRAQRNRHRRLVPGRAGVRPARCSTTSASTRAGRSSRSSAGSPGRRAWRIWSRPPTDSAPTCSWCCARARPTRRRSPPRSRPRCQNCRAPAPACSGSARCCRSARFAKYSRQQRFSSARRCTSRWASSIWRRWPARRRWWPRTSAAFRRWWPTGSPGLLVHYDAADTAGFESRLADAVNALVADPERAEFGRAGRQRCIDEFSWAHIAEQTLEIYRKVCA